MKRTIIRLQTFYKYKELFFQLISRDIKLRYRRSFLGYLWSILNPLLMMLVKILVFSNLFARGIPNFPIYLITGYIIFQFITGSGSSSLYSIIGNAGLLKKIYIPKYIFTLASITSEIVIFFFSLGALIIVILVTGTPLTLRFFLLVIPIIQLYVFCVGLGLFLAQAMVFFRDIQHLWNVFSSAWMFLSAIFYPVEILPDALKHIIICYNPMYFYITMARNFIIGTVHDLGMTDLVIRGSIAAVLMLVIGFISFTRNKNKFILYI